MVVGAWAEQSPVALPEQPRSPDAMLGDIAITDDGIVMSVQADGGDSARPEGAIYVIPWPVEPPR
jgi:hypothetical protein